VRSALNTRALFENLHRRADGLDAALERYRARKRALAGARNG